MLKEIIIAIQSYGKAHQFIKQHKLWKWILLPGLIYTILFLTSIYYFGKTASIFIGWLSLKTGLKTWLDSMDSGLLGFLFTLAGLMLWLIQMLFYFSLFKYIWLIIGSPVFSYLSEKTENIIKGEYHPFNFKLFIQGVYRGIKVAIRNALWQTVLFIGIFFLALLPVLGWITPLMSILNEYYYYGISMLDYGCERRKMTIQESSFFINRHKGLAIGNGIMFYLMHLLPLIGWVLAPSYAVIAATLSIIEIMPATVQKEESL